MKKIFLITAIVSTIFTTSCSEEGEDINTQEEQRIASAVLIVSETAAVSGSTWSISSFIDDGEDITNIFDGYTIEFVEGGTLVVNTPNGVFTGSWEIDRDEDDDDEADDDGDDDFYDDIEFEIEIAGDDALDELDDDYEVFSVTDNEIVLADDDEDDDDDDDDDDNNDIDRIVLTRN